VQTNIAASASSVTLSFDLYIVSQPTAFGSYASIFSMGLNPSEGEGESHVTINLNEGNFTVQVYDSSSVGGTPSILTSANSNQWYHLSLGVSLAGPDAGASLALEQCGASVTPAFASFADAGFPAKATSGYFALGLVYVTPMTGMPFAIYIDNVVFNAE
jgi:hypothetical protein